MIRCDGGGILIVAFVVYHDPDSLVGTGALRVPRPGNNIIPATVRKDPVAVGVPASLTEIPCIVRIVTLGIQEKAYAMCQRNDHSWMGEEEYAGNSYLRETKTDKGEYTITVGFVHTCYFCGYKEYRYF